VACRDWRDQAACRAADPHLFDYDPETDPETAAEPARRICARCPVRTACLNDALAQPEGGDLVGIFGGLTPAERAARRGQEGTQPSPPLRHSWRLSGDPEFAVASFELATKVGTGCAANQLGVSPPLLYRAWDRQALGRPPTPAGWTKRFVTDRGLVEQAFAFARAHSILAAASAFQISAPTLRRALVHHGLGHPHAGLDRAELVERWNGQAKDGPDHHQREQRRRSRARLTARWGTR